MRAFVKITCLTLSLLMISSMLFACVDDKEESKETSSLTTADQSTNDDFGPLIPLETDKD